MEDILTKTAEGINSGKLNIYELDWGDRTLCSLDKMAFIMEHIDIDKIMLVSEAIINDIECLYLKGGKRDEFGNLEFVSFWWDFGCVYLPPEGEWDYESEITRLAENIVKRKTLAEKYNQQVLQKNSEQLTPAQEEIDELRKENEELKQEVERLKEKYAFEGEDKGEPLETEFTATPRQVILMFRALGIDIESGDVNKIATSQFLSKLTGKNQQNIRTRLSGFDENSKQTKKDKEIVEKMISDTGIRRK